jgi:UDP-glucose 4-epimerase
MKILITGGAGFVASHIVDACVARGDDVVVVDNLSSGALENVNARAKFVACDIRSDTCVALIESERPEVIIHHAAQPQVGPSIRDPFHDLEVNGRGLLVVLSAAVRAGVRQVVYASSGGTVYGTIEHLPISEDFPTYPENPYGTTKLAGEHYLRYFARVGKFAGTVLRYANVYGPRDHVSSEHVITVFAEHMLKCKTCTVHWDGEQAKDYVYISDIVRANIMAIDARASGIFNIGSGRGVSVNSIFAMLEHIIGPQPTPHQAPKREGDVRAFYLDCTRARDAFGWEPITPMPEGLTGTVAWFRDVIAPQHPE